MRLQTITVSCGALLVLALSQPVLADKPEWAGKKETPSQEQVEAHKAEMKAKRSGAEEKMEETRAQYKKDGKEGKKGKGDEEKLMKRDREHQDDAEQRATEMKQERDRKQEKIMEQQQDMKTEAQQSLTQEQSQEKSRKWWKFWN